MIFNTINSVKMDALIPNYTCDIGIKLVGMILFNSWKAILCPEDKVIQ